MRTKSSNWLQVIVIIIWDSNLSILKFMLHQKQEYHCAQFFGDTCKDFKESYPTFLGPHLWQAHMQRPRRWTRNVSDSLLLLAALLSLWLWHRRVLCYLLIFHNSIYAGLSTIPGSSILAAPYSSTSLPDLRASCIHAARHIRLRILFMRYATITLSPTDILRDDIIIWYISHRNFLLSSTEETCEAFTMGAWSYILVEYMRAISLASK